MEQSKDPAQPQERESSETSRSARRRYEPPRLVEYGSVGKLTQSGGNTTKDSGNMKRVCL